MTPSASSRHPREGGFTLLEALAGLALASLVLVMLNMAMSGLRQGADKTREMLGRQASIATAADVFAADVARISRMRRKGGGYLFQGRMDEMIYPVTEHAGVQRPAPFLVRLFVRQGRGDGQLVRQRLPLAAGETAAAETEWQDEVVLLSGPFDMAFAYRSPRRGTRAWSGDWRSTQMPEQIRLAITDRATGRLRVPVIVQSLQVDAETECTSPRDAICGIGVAEAP